MRPRDYPIILLIPNHSARLIDVAALKLDLMNSHTKRVIENILIDQSVAAILNTNQYQLDFSKIENNLRASIDETVKNIEKIMIDPAIQAIIGDDIKERIVLHMQKTDKARRDRSLRVIGSATSPQEVETPNFALLIHSCLILSMATYNLELDVPKEFRDIVDRITEGMRLFDKSWEDASHEIDNCRAGAWAALALGYSCYESSFDPAMVKVYSIRSHKACCILAYDVAKKTASLAFRGTRDPIDVVTDLTVLSSEFKAKEDLESGIFFGRMEVHQGFLSAFESLSQELSDVMGKLPKDTKLIVTGHSMGGALAQIAAAYYCHMVPILVTFGSPAIGNTAFCEFVERRVSPAGGLQNTEEIYKCIDLSIILSSFHHHTKV